MVLKQRLSQYGTASVIKYSNSYSPSGEVVSTAGASVVGGAAGVVGAAVVVAAAVVGAASDVGAASEVGVAVGAAVLVGASDTGAAVVVAAAAVDAVGGATPFGYTLIVIVSLVLSSLHLTVILAVPSPTIVTLPVESTLTTLVALELNVRGAVYIGFAST